MKNIIAITSLLATTGTAFAGFTQDDSVAWLALDSSGVWKTSSDVTFTKNADGSLTLKLADGLSWTAQDNTRRSFTWALTFDFDKISEYSTAEKMLTIDSSTVTGVGVSSGKLTGWWSDSAYTKLTLANPPSGESTVLFSFTNSGSRFWKDSSTYWSNTDLKGSIGDATTLTISADAASALTQFVAWTDGCYGNTEIVAAAAAQAFATANSLVIPEPSAFGLLAGVGALALVVARRRRRAK